MYYNDFKGKKISALGYGGLRFPYIEGNENIIDREKSQALVDAAMAGGINYYDTAHIYQQGDSEKFFGEALSKYERSSYNLSTKYYHSRKAIKDRFEEQLKRCNTEYFDFYMLHSLDNNYIVPFMDKEKDYLGFLLEQKKAGRIKNIGFSSHADPDTLSKFLDWYDDFDMALIQLNYLDWELLHAKEQYEILTAHNIPVWVMEPLKGGRLSVLNEDARKILKEAAPEMSISSWGFRFLMGLPNVTTVLSGMSDAEQIEDNLKTFENRNPLSPEELQVLERAKEAFMKDLGAPCSECRYCTSHCPQELDIPLLIKGYNEFRATGDTWKVTDFDKARGAENCIACGACLEHCPQKINIPDILKKFVEETSETK